MATLKFSIVLFSFHFTNHLFLLRQSLSPSFSTTPSFLSTAAFCYKLMDLKFLIGPLHSSLIYLFSNCSHLTSLNILMFMLINLNWVKIEVEWGLKVSVKVVVWLSEVARKIEVLRASIYSDEETANTLNGLLGLKLEKIC